MSQTEHHGFQAEIAQLLEIVIHSLYTDKEIFIRELVSNAADASEKLQFIQQTAETEVYQRERPLEIHVTTDDQAKTITIADSGIGMSREELIKNLGTIAHSGSKAFLEQIQRVKSDSHLIGQFGVGFYSAFMVADSVTVLTRSHRPEEGGWKWESDGKTGYTLTEAADLDRGTKVILSLKDVEFAGASRVEGVIKHYSNFVAFPISLNGKLINTIQPLWTKNRNEISQDEYVEFYKYIGHDSAAPHSHLFFSADAPLSIRAILFCPERNTELLTMSRQEGEVHLYSKRVLITPKAKGLLPEWLRFLKGVVDSEDLPLNISRETMQDSALLRKLNEVLTKRVLKWLEEEAVADADKFAKFFAQHGHCLKEGLVTDWSHREALAKLLRFKSSWTEGEKLTSLADYVSRMPETQKDIYYLTAPDRSAALASPDFEVFRRLGQEVVFLEDPRDEFVFEHLRNFSGKNLTAAGRADVELEDRETSGGGLNPSQVDTLVAFIKETLGDRVGTVRSSKRLVESPAAIREGEDALSPSLRRMMKMMGQEEGGGEAAKPDLEINAESPLIAGLERLSKADPELSKQLAEQIYDNALAAAGMVEDARPAIGRLNGLLARLLERQGS